MREYRYMTTMISGNVDEMRRRSVETEVVRGRGDETTGGRKEGAGWAFLKFHDFWNAYDPSVPRMLVRYEDVLDSCPTQVDRMLAFANATSASDAAKACEEVRPVDYEHGTLVKRVCGIDAARRLDKVVGRVARELGYAFDHASGVWRVRSLP